MVTIFSKKKEPIYNVLEKKWYIDFDTYFNKLRERLEKEKREKDVVDFYAVSER